MRIYSGGNFACKQTISHRLAEAFAAKYVPRVALKTSTCVVN